MPEILSGNPVFEDVSELKRRIDSQILNNDPTSIVDNSIGMGTSLTCGDVNDFHSYPHEGTKDGSEIKNGDSRHAAPSKASTDNQNKIDVSYSHSDEENADSTVCKSEASVLNTNVPDKVVNNTESSKTYNDLPLDVGANSKFSKVLENISLPLLYIPTTKQLVSGSHETHPDDNCSTSATLTDKEYLSVSVDRLGSIHGSEQNLNSPNSLSSNTLLMPPSSSSSSMHKAHSTQEFSASVPQFPDLDHLHSAESFTSFAQHIEFGVSNFGDDSSLSNVSTGTDFSISAMSMGGEEGAGGYSDTKSLSLSQHVTDETLFMDINLHTRNSYDQNRKSASLDSKLKDQHIPLSQAAKKHPLMGFK